MTSKVNTFPKGQVDRAIQADQEITKCVIERKITSNAIISPCQNLKNYLLPKSKKLKKYPHFKVNNQPIQKQNIECISY